MSAFAAFARPFFSAHAAPRREVRDEKPSLFSVAMRLAAAAEAGRPLPEDALRQLLDR